MKVIKYNESFDTEELTQLKRNISLSGWQRQIYILLTERLNNVIFDKMMTYINRIIPNEATEKEKKLVILRSMSDYLDSVL
jgi:hypothetical protein